MTLGAIVGGFFAAHYAQRVPQTWIRAFVIIVGSLQRDYLPSAWATYAPTWIEIADGA